MTRSRDAKVNVSCCPSHHGQTNANRNDSNINNQRKGPLNMAGSTHHVCLVGHVEANDGLAIVSATTVVRSCGRHAGTGSVSAHGLARGRAKVSPPSTSGGNKLESMRQDDVIEDQGENRIHHVGIARRNELSAARVREVIGARDRTVTGCRTEVA